MSIKKLGRIKKTFVTLLVVGFVLSVTAASVSAWNGGKGGAGGLFGVFNGGNGGNGNNGGTPPPSQALDSADPYPELLDLGETACSAGAADLAEAAVHY